MKYAHPELELYGILEHINCINRLVRVCLDHTDRNNLIDHRGYLIDATDMMLAQIDIAREFLGDIQNNRAKPTRKTKEAAE